MTKEEVELIFKRYAQVTQAIKSGLSRAVFYVGNRRQVIEITEEVKMVCKFIRIVHRTEPDPNIRYIIRGIKLGISDKKLMKDTHYSKSGFYGKKKLIEEKIFDLCILHHLVSAEEILSRTIA